MAKSKAWEVTGDFWSRVEPLIPVRARVAERLCARKAGGGRKPKGPRLVFEGIDYVLRTGCQWKALPVERYGSASAVLWQLGFAQYDEFEGIAWRWQSIDDAMMKASLAQQSVGANPTDRGKMGANAIC